MDSIDATHVALAYFSEMMVIGGKLKELEYFTVWQSTATSQSQSQTQTQTQIKKN